MVARESDRLRALLSMVRQDERAIGQDLLQRALAAGVWSGELQLPDEANAEGTDTEDPPPEYVKPPTEPGDHPPSMHPHHAPVPSIFDLTKKMVERVTSEIEGGGMASSNIYGSHMPVWAPDTKLHFAQEVLVGEPGRIDAPSPRIGRPKRGKRIRTTVTGKQNKNWTGPSSKPTDITGMEGLQDYNT